MLEWNVLRGLRVGAFQQFKDAIVYGMVLMYIGQKVSMLPRTDHTPTKHERNQEIRVRYAAGEQVVYLAQVFGLSEQRVSQIVRGKRR
jgi:Mor family transcriptional regulator